MKFLIALTFIVTSSICFSQTIDTVMYISDPSPALRIIGSFNSTGIKISKTEIKNSNFNIYFNTCYGYTEIVPFDTTFSNISNFPLNKNEITVYSIIDTNTINTNCEIINDFDTTQVYQKILNPVNITNVILKEKIYVYYKKDLKTIVLEKKPSVKILKIELFDNSGKLIKNCNADSEYIDCTGLRKGEYLMKIKFQDSIQTYKILIQ